MKKNLLLTIASVLFSTALYAQTIPPVVINKLYNSGNVNGDALELLILKDHCDLRNLYIKDIAIGINDQTLVDQGGGFRFLDISFWSNLRVGTTIILRSHFPTTNIVSADQDGSDKTLDISLNDNNFFSSGRSGQFNIQTNDAVFIKGGNSFSGFDNVIHAYAVGIGSSGSGANTYVYQEFDAILGTNNKTRTSSLLSTNYFIGHNR